MPVQRPCAPSECRLQTSELYNGSMIDMILSYRFLCLHKVEAHFLHIPLPLLVPTFADTVPWTNQTKFAFAVPSSELQMDQDHQWSSDDSWYLDDEVLEVCFFTQK